MVRRMRTPLSDVVEDMNESQLQQHFRLQMIKLFGSMSSALYELGMDAETGCMSVKEFQDALNDRLGLYTRDEAKQIITNVIATDHDELAVSYGDFGVAVEEWHLTLKWKEQTQEMQRYRLLEDDLTRGACSGSSGSSWSRHPRDAWDPAVSGRLGIYLRPSCIKTVPGRSPRFFGLNQKTSAQTAKKFPWQQPQQTWVGSIFAGAECSNGVVPHSEHVRKQPKRCSKKPFTCPARTTILETTVRFSEMGQPDRHISELDRSLGFTQTTCPVSRKEMEPSLCMKQMARWWPYAKTKPQTRLNPRAVRYSGGPSSGS